MKRLFSLAALLLCSLTLCAAAHAQQTWRLTNDAYSDSLPKIAIDNAGRTWVVWLSNAPGNYDVYCRRFEGTTWGDTFRIQADDSSQNHLVIGNDRINNRVWVAWNSCALIQGGQYINDTLRNVSILNDSLHPLLSECEFFQKDVPFFLALNDSGVGYLTWSSPVTWSHSLLTGLGSVMLRKYDGFIWGNIDTILVGSDEWPGFQFSVRGLSVDAHMKPIMYTFRFADADGARPFVNSLVHWDNDSCNWLYTGVVVSDNHPAKPLAVAEWNKIYAFYHFVGYATTPTPLYCKSFSSSNFQYDSCQIISDSADAYTMSSVTSAVNDCNQPHIVWNDRGSIYLSKLIDTLWSKPAIQISDTSLHNCINPDIVAANDSMVWVCYQNDGDIYVTRTSIPLGVSEKPTVQIPNPQSKISLKSWPNPANNVIHFSYTLPAKRNSSVSIYDIAGRLIRTLDISGNQTDWNCADQSGRRAASGVYFARLKSGGQETIQRISIIK